MFRRLWIILFFCGSGVIIAPLGPLGPVDFVFEARQQDCNFGSLPRSEECVGVEPEPMSLLDCSAGDVRSRQTCGTTS